MGYVTRFFYSVKTKVFYVKRFLYVFFTKTFCECLTIFDKNVETKNAKFKKKDGVHTGAA